MPIRRLALTLTSLLSLTAAFAVVPVVAAASADTAPPMPYFVEWTPGTALPTVPSGWHIEAWPTDANTTLTPGQTEATTMVSGSTTAAQIAAIPVSDTDAAGVVNLQVLPGGIPCETKFLRNVGSEETMVGQAYSTINSNQTFVFAVGTSSSLGVGVSYTDESSGFSASGDVSVSGGGTDTFPTEYAVTYNHYFTYFEVGEWETFCSPSNYYTIKPYEWNAGEVVVHPGGPPGATHCSPYPAGGKFQQTTTTASTINAGFTVLGFTGKSTAGYSSTASMNFKFNVAGQLCGTVGHPGNGGPGVLVAS